jgi:hypothetical protein
MLYHLLTAAFNETLANLPQVLTEVSYIVVTQINGQSR